MCTVGNTNGDISLAYFFIPQTKIIRIKKFPHILLTLSVIKT